jgi:hypothetical protein
MHLIQVSSTAAGKRAQIRPSCRQVLTDGIERHGRCRELTCLEDENARDGRRVRKHACEPTEGFGSVARYIERQLHPAAECRGMLERLRKARLPLTLKREVDAQMTGPQPLQPREIA